MSTEIVKSERNKVSFQEVERVTNDLSITVPVLSPDSPMPLDFASKWDAVKTQLKDAVINNVAGARTTVGRSIGFSRWRVRLAASMENFSGEVRIMGAGGALGGLGGAFTAFLVEFPVLAGGFMGGFLGGACIGLATLGFAEISQQKLNRFFDAADSGYEQRVAQWAQERYGVTLLNRWGNPGDRLADDIIYVGEKDGQKVYCQETPDGWVLTYKDGTELPVLAKELTTV